MTSVSELDEADAVVEQLSAAPRRSRGSRCGRARPWRARPWWTRAARSPSGQRRSLSSAVWPIATSPGSACRCCSLKTWATRPMSRRTVSVPPVGDGDPGRFLPPVLEREQAEVRETRDVRSRADAEDATHQSATPRAQPLEGPAPNSVAPPPSRCRAAGRPARRRASGSPAPSRARTHARPPTSPKSSSGSSQTELGAAARSGSPPRRGNREPALGRVVHERAPRRRAPEKRDERASASRSSGAGSPPTSSKRAWYSSLRDTPATRLREMTSPSRQTLGTRRTSATSPTRRRPASDGSRGRSSRCRARRCPRRPARRAPRTRVPCRRSPPRAPSRSPASPVAEVEAVGEAERLAAGTGDVARRLEHGERAAGERVERGDPSLPVERDREAAVGRPQPQHRRVESRPAHGARLTRWS